MKRRVLFLCSKNSVYGPMAEALLRQIDSRNFEGFSAGITCQQVHPLTLEVMREVGVDLGQHIPRLVDELATERFDFVIVLDEVQQPHLHAGTTVHWKFENPLVVSQEREGQRRAFRSVRDQIAQRLRLFAIVNSRQTTSSERNLHAKAH